MSNDTEQNQLNGCLLWAFVIAVGAGLILYFAARWIFHQF